jgi:HEAT repeat protein
MKTAITLLLAATALAPLARANTIPDSGASITVIDSGDSDDRKEMEEDLYDSATDALDDHDWRRAASEFRKVAAMKMSHADSAMYWLAYAQNKMGQRSEALSTIIDLQKSYPKSKWNEDAKALEVEIRQSAGQKIQPEHVGDEDLKLMAIMGLMQSDPERAIPILEGILSSTNNSSKVKDRALFVLSQSSSPRAAEILANVAKGSAHHDLQSKAIRYLGIMGGENSRRVLADVYNSSSDASVKKSILRSYMISGDKGRLLTLARGEQNADLRAEAVQQLGVMGAREELSQLYESESSIDVKKKIIQAMFIGGNAQKLGELARTESNLDLKLAAIRNLGLLGGSRSGQLLFSLYESDSRPEIRKGVIQGLFLQSNAKGLVDLARKEKDPELKRAIVEKLAIMHSKEATDYLMEFLKE